MESHQIAPAVVDASPSEGATPEASPRHAAGGPTGFGLGVARDKKSPAVAPALPEGASWSSVHRRGYGPGVARDYGTVNNPTATGPLRNLMLQLHLDPSMEVTSEMVLGLVREEFPQEISRPSPQLMDDAILRVPSNGFEYEAGMWVERLGNDMVWHVEPIRRMVRVASDEENAQSGDFTFFYKTSAGVLVGLDEVRAPEEGLKRQFGMRPWVWQQWANLRLEAYVRFQEHHERDFMEVDLHRSVMFLWNYWFEDERNADFRAHFYSKPEMAQTKLVHHVTMPFKICQDALRWDLEDSAPSVYQYCSFLGSGYTTALMLFFIQMVVPFLLIIFAVRETLRFPNYNHELCASYDIPCIFETDWETFCNRPTAFDTVFMNTVVFVVYALRVVPTVWDQFYEVVGDKDTMTSRLNSLRTVSWLQGDDTTWMQIGFKIDRYMKSFYIAVINVLMLIILFLTDSTLEVILNALAIEFVYNFDREIPATVWYDPGFRFLRAAIVELLIVGELRLEFLWDPKVFCEQYDVDPELFAARVPGGTLRSFEQGTIDFDDPKWMLTAKDKVWHACAQVANQMEHPEAKWQFIEQVTGFGYVDQIMHYLGLDKTGIFNRYVDLYTWSRWDEALYIARVPLNGGTCASQNLASVRDEARAAAAKRGAAVPASPSGSSQAPSSSGRSVRDAVNYVLAAAAAGDVEYANFNPNSSLPADARFFHQVVDVFMGKAILQTLRMAVRRGLWFQLLPRLVDGVMEIFFFAVIVFFPVTLVGYVALIFYCQPIEDVTAGTLAPTLAPSF